jgi:hypothetical protein
VTLVGPGFADTGDIKLRTDVVKAGLNIRFGGWGGPVVAKY